MPPTTNFRTYVLLILVMIASGAASRAQFSGQLPFGKNKVQYQRFEWKYIQSENFDVYFHQGGDYAAKYTALKAEEALREIQSTLSFSITKRIALIVYNSHNQFQQTNVIDQFMSEGIGGVTELFKNRVVIPFEGDYKKFAHVIHHELVHAVINDMFYGGSIQSLMSNSARAMLPLWMNEGFAEYSSVGGLDVKTDQFMRDVAVSEYLRGLHQLSGYFAYRGGQAFWAYVAEKYGKGKVGEVLNRFRTVGDLNQTFRGSFGMTYEEMSEQWAKDTKKFYFPDVNRYEYVEDYSTRLTNHQKENNFYNSSPAISPDGTRIAFISDRGDGLFALYTMNLDTKEIDKLAGSARSTDFEELNFLTPGISWDPTGRKLAVGAKAGGEDGLYLVDAVNGDYEILTFDIQTIGGVHWSPSGRYIALDAAPGGSQSDIYIYDLETKQLSQITNDVFTDVEPVWGPDSETLYFISDRGRFTSGTETVENFHMWEHDVDQRDVYRVNINDRVIERLTSDPNIGKYSLAVAPDHRSLLFTADYNGITNLWELDLVSKTRQARTNSLQEISQISMSKDGTKLVFSSQNRVGYDLFLLKFPFEQSVRDTLPLTRFRQREMDELNSLASIMDEAASNADTTVLSYGNFDVDFHRTTMVPPNDEIVMAGDPVKTASDPRVDFTPKDYRVSFSPDVITGQAGYSNWFGAQGTAQMLFTDMMGDHEIYFMANLFLDLNNSNFFLQYTYKPEIVDFSVAGFHNAGFTYVNQGFGTTLNRLRTYGGAVWATVPFSRYTRLDLGVSAQAMVRENIDIPTQPPLERFVMVPTMSYVFDDVVWGFWAPVKGTRFNFTLEASPPIGSNGLAFATLRGDVREYIHLGGMYCLALRASGGTSMGRDPQKFFIGGVDNWFNRFFSSQGWPFQNPEDFAFTRPGWPLRGYAINERNGSQYFLGNAEFRFPLLFALQAGPLPAIFQGLQGQAFFDIGGAFDENGNAWSSIGGIPVPAPDPILYSMGIGVRSLALGLPLRFDIAWRHQAAGGFSAPIYLFSLGGDF
jgi:Tol biopolymer transport system component